jgi:hypothetical protein
MRIGDEGIILIVKKLARWRAGGDDQVIESRQTQGCVCALAQRGQVLGIELGEAVVHERIRRTL